MWRVDFFFKISKRDFTFIREMRVKVTTVKKYLVGNFFSNTLQQQSNNSSRHQHLDRHHRFPARGPSFVDFRSLDADAEPTPKLCIPSIVNTWLIFWHTTWGLVGSKMTNHGLNHRLLSLGTIHVLPNQDLGFSDPLRNLL